jgi:pimeloyl-ACP methyl ester carboxylesterase
VAAAVEAMSRGAEAYVDASMTRELYAAVRPGTEAYARLRRMLLDNFKALTSLRPGFVQYPGRATIERLAEIKVPTLVIIGSRDGANLRNIADTLAAGIPGARKAVIDGSSHHPPVEKPKEFNRVLLDFLEEGKRQK